MKKILIIILIFFATFASAQTCPFITCKDSLASTITVGSLAINSGYSSATYSIVSGPGVIVGSTITGLVSGKTTVVQLLAISGGVATVAVKVITVAAVPFAQRTATTINCANGKCAIGYDDKSITQL
jgi:hypothetical protein